jgi:hypothetical protein
LPLPPTEGEGEAGEGQDGVKDLFLILCKTCQPRGNIN